MLSMTKHSLPFFLDDQNIAIFYHVNTPPCSSVLVHSKSLCVNLILWPNTINIRLTILAPFLSNLITSFILTEQVSLSQRIMLHTQAAPARWNLPCRGEEASQQEVSTQVRQQEELVGVSLLHPIRTNRSS